MNSVSGFSPGCPTRYRLALGPATRLHNGLCEEKRRESATGLQARKGEPTGLRTMEATGPCGNGGRGRGIGVAGRAGLDFQPGFGPLPNRDWKFLFYFQIFFL
jgi:hypothetical protein